MGKKPAVQSKTILLSLAGVIKSVVLLVAILAGREEWSTDLVTDHAVNIGIFIAIAYFRVGSDAEIDGWVRSAKKVAPLVFAFFFLGNSACGTVHREWKGNVLIEATSTEPCVITVREEGSDKEPDTYTSPKKCKLVE